jgi:hypothetical protein
MFYIQDILKSFYESFEDTQGCYQKRNLKNDRKNI